MLTGGQIQYGGETIPFEVEERPRRRTLGIEVHPDGQVLVLVPPDSSETLIMEKLRSRAKWISRQRTGFTQYEERETPRLYVSGESHRYLGRQYRLRVRGNSPDVPKDRVILTRGELVVAGPAPLPPDRVRGILRKWYLDRAKTIFPEVLETCFISFERKEFDRPPILIREMRSRWGSLSQGGRMMLNTNLIQASKPCIEYVITHELCHLIHRDHNAQFFTLLRRVMPDWEERKRRLEQTWA